MAHELVIEPSDVHTVGQERGLQEAGFVLLYQMRAFDIAKRVAMPRLGAATPRFRATVEQALNELFGLVR